MLERYKYIFNIALEAVFLNKFRSSLTALGIIFGVAAVITMMAIGNGAKKEILDQIKLVGVNNILILPKSEKHKDASSGSGSGDQSSQSQDQGSDKNQQKFSPGLSLDDARAISTVIPTVLTVSPEVDYKTDILKDGVKASSKLTGVSPDFFKAFSLDLQEGTMFNEEQLTQGKSVCIIGPTLKSKFFPSENAVGKDIKCGPIWLHIVGVLKKREISQSSIDDLGISDYNNSIYAPIQTLLRRFKDRSMITSKSLHGGSVFYDGWNMISTDDGSSVNEKNQLDKIVVQVKESSDLLPTVDILKKMMLRRHHARSPAGPHPQSGRCSLLSRHARQAAPSVLPR